MAAEKISMTCLLGAMDRLWFHQIILFPEPSQFLSHEIRKTPLFSSKNIIQELPEQEISPQASVFTNSQDAISSPESDCQERQTRLKLVSSKKNRSRSSSPILAQKKMVRNLRNSRLHKSMSCRSLGELELEEVKGFMDLGFTFKKESLSKKIMSLVPGLQRLDIANYENNIDQGKYNYEVIDDSEDDEEEEIEEKNGIMRPYLSDAWLIKRPDSPLLNLRIPRVATNADDMKKHLKYWARTVALAVQQES